MSESITFTVPKTKKALNSILVAERKSMREKHKQSAFMKKTLSVYNGMMLRLSKLGKPEPNFTLANFRQWVSDRMTICSYCGDALRPSNWTADHEVPLSRGGSVELENLALCCKPCNFQKGKLTGYEFRCLLTDYLPTLPVEAATDIKRRLTIGGKWSFKS
jgi:hypothetical protein